MTGRHFRIIGTAILLSLAGCTEKKEERMDLKIHYPKVAITLDPHRMEDAYSMMMVSQLFRGLLRFNSSGDVVPDLADSWVESGDRKTYRFKLKPMTFSNGEKITARHVQLSFARIFLLSSGMGADLDYIKGAKELHETKDLAAFGVQPVSADEVEFQLVTPSALFLKHVAVADCAILPIQNLASIADPPASFSGPYRLERETQDGVREFIKWRSDAEDSSNPPERLMFFATTEDPLQLARGEKTDSLDRDAIRAEDRDALKTKGWGMSPTELTGETFIILNPKHLSMELRKHLYAKTDQAKLVAHLKEPQFKAAYGVIPTGFPGELSSDDVSELLTSPFLYKGKKVSFQLDFDPSSDVEKSTAEFLKGAWESDLVEVRLNPLSKAEKLQRMFSKTSQAVLGRKGIDYPDGFSVLTYFKGKYSSNYFHVDDPEIDAAIEGTLKDFDPQARAVRYKKIQLQILRHYTMIPLFFGSQASGLWSHKVKAVPSHPMGSHTMHLETLEMRSR